MTVQHKAVVTCNECGVSEELPMSNSLSPFWSGPSGWLTIEFHGVNPMFQIGTDTPDQARNRKPDLCSWSCMARYAENKARGG